tara:strand:+ start:47 stop:250 length:204 start_codon:yes stop_codon:yes gene_type:complete
MTIILCFFIKDAYAYLDPGTGSMIIQVVIAAFVAVGIYIKLFWHKFKNLFTKKHKKENVEGKRENKD